MSTPAFSVPALTPKEINRALEEEERRQRDATPEPKFRKQDAPQPYDLLCQIEHRKFTPEEVDIIRMGIDQPMYWEREAQNLKTKLVELIWSNLLQQYDLEGVSRAEMFRNVTMALHRRVKRHGYTKQQVRKSRLAIEHQSYWEPELERLRSASAHREEKMREDHWTMKANDREIPGLAEQEMHSDGSKRMLQHKPQAASAQTIRCTRRSLSNLAQVRDNRVLKSRVQPSRVVKRVR